MKEIKQEYKIGFGILVLIMGLGIMTFPGYSWGNADTARICGAIFTAAGLIITFC